MPHPYKFTVDAGVALLFFVLYALMFAWLARALFLKHIKLKSRYGVLFFHVLIRLGSQGCGIAFGILVFDNIGVFLAYLILGAEGYFTLVLCAYRFLISWHQHNLPNHESWLEPPNPKRQRLPLLLRIFWPDHPMGNIHLLLGVANSIIISGGSFLSNTRDEPDPDIVRKNANLAKIFRTTGQSVFLAINVWLLVLIVQTMFKDKKNMQYRSTRSGRRGVHITLWILVGAWIPLMVRGVFGCLQAAVNSLSYTNEDNYTAHGFTPRYAAIEYSCGVAPEFLACLFLIATYYTSKGDPPKRDGFVDGIELKDRPLVPEAEKGNATRTA